MVVIDKVAALVAIPAGVPREKEIMAGGSFVSFRMP